MKKKTKSNDAAIIPQPEQVKFSTLNGGQRFIYKNDEFVKLATGYKLYERDPRYGNEEREAYVNAVRLHDGRPSYFDNEEVRPLTPILPRICQHTQVFAAIKEKGDVGELIGFYLTWQEAEEMSEGRFKEYAKEAISPSEWEYTDDNTPVSHYGQEITTLGELKNIFKEKSL